MTFFVCCEWQLKQENHSTLYFLLHPKSLSYYNQGEVAHMQPTANDKISKIAGLLIVLLLLPCFESFNFKNLIYILDAKSLILVQINVLKYMTRNWPLILLPLLTQKPRYLLLLVFNCFLRCCRDIYLKVRLQRGWFSLKLLNRQSKQNKLTEKGNKINDHILAIYSKFKGGMRNISLYLPHVLTRKNWKLGRLK